MKLSKTAAFITALTIAALSLTGCAEDKMPAESQQNIESKTDSSESSAYSFETKDHQIEVDGRKYQVFDKQVRFNYKDTPYEEWLSYVSPYDEYVPKHADTEDGTKNDSIFTREQTIASAIRYAYENGIEEIEFPVEFGDAEIYYGWEYAGLHFPNIPLAAGSCDIALTAEGYYKIHIADSVLKAASHTEETIAAAKEIVDSMPSACVTDADKAYYLYDWVCRNIAYDVFHADSTINVNNEPQSAYGALVKKRAVCDGIAGAVQLLFNMADIECGKVYVYSSDPDDETSHVWNYAYIDGEVWDFDATWDIERYFESEDDTITEGESDGMYNWFGADRSARSREYDIADDCLLGIPTTNTGYTENSPALKVFDYVTTIDMENQKLITFHKGKQTEELDLDELRKCLEEKGRVTMKYDNEIVMITDFTTIEKADPIFDGIDNNDLIEELDVYSKYMILSK